MRTHFRCYLLHWEMYRSRVLSESISNRKKELERFSLRLLFIIVKQFCTPSCDGVTQVKKKNNNISIIGFVIGFFNVPYVFFCNFYAIKEHIYEIAFTQIRKLCNLEIYLVLQLRSSFVDSSTLLILYISILFEISQTFVHVRECASYLEKIRVSRKCVIKAQKLSVYSDAPYCVAKFVIYYTRSSTTFFSFYPTFYPSRFNPSAI